MKYRVVLFIFFLCVLTLGLEATTQAQDTLRKEKTYKRKYYKDRRHTDMDTVMVKEYKKTKTTRARSRK